MRLIATTVVRESTRGKQRTGYIYDVDWDARTVSHRLAVPEPRFPESDDNPRGGVRGGRGVAVTRHGIVVANYDTLLRYDDDWQQLDEFSHPLFVGTHEIDWDGEFLWTTSTAIDVVLKVDLNGVAEAAWDPHASEFASRHGLRRRPHPVDGSVDYRVREAPLLDNCHINGVTRRDGVTVVNCGLVRKPKAKRVRLVERAQARARRAVGKGEAARREHGRHSARSLVVRVNGNGPEELLLELPNVDYPTHNGQLLDEARIVLNDSTRNTLRVFATEGARQLQSLEIPGTWLRGLEPVDGSRVFVGTAPASIVLIDLERNAIDAVVRLSDDPNEAVHGLTIAPPPGERR